MVTPKVPLMSTDTIVFNRELTKNYLLVFIKGVPYMLYEGGQEKTCFCICENKDADQVCNYCAADQCLCFCYIDL